MTIDRYFEMPEMTIELAVDRMNRIIEYKKLGMSEYEVALDTEALTMAIKSLEAWRKVKEQIKDEAEFAYANFDEYKYEVLGVDDVDDLPNDDFRYGMERTLEIINKYKEEEKVEVPKKDIIPIESHKVTPNITNSDDVQIRDKKLTFQDGQYFEEYTEVRVVRRAITREQFLAAV